MHPVEIVFSVVAAVVVFAIAAGSIGRESRRLDALAPRAIYDLEVVTVWVADRLPPATQARLTMDELRGLLTLHLNWLGEHDLMPIDVTDRVQDIAEPVVADENVLAALLIARAAERGIEIIDDVDVVHVVDAHNAYLAAIGAVGPHADKV